jgi:hypothetical protein
LDPYCTFEATEQGVQEILDYFESWLHQLLAQFALSARIVQHGPNLQQGVHHLARSGKLLATLDFPRRAVGIAPSAQAQEVWQGQWQKRPLAAGVSPPGFIERSVVELNWIYVRHSAKDLLPARYRAAKIYFRQSPQVPTGWLRESHWSVIKELSAGPVAFNELVQKTALPPSLLANELACLYHARAISTNPAKAGLPSNSEHHFLPSLDSPASSDED